MLGDPCGTDNNQRFHGALPTTASPRRTTRRPASTPTPGRRRYRSGRRRAAAAGARGACSDALAGSPSNRSTEAVRHRTTSQPQGSTRLLPVAARDDRTDLRGGCSPRKPTAIWGPERARCAIASGHDEPRRTGRRRRAPPTRPSISTALLLDADTGHLELTAAPRAKGSSARGPDPR